MSQSLRKILHFSYSFQRYLRTQRHRLSCPVLSELPRNSSPLFRLPQNVPPSMLLLPRPLLQQAAFDATRYFDATYKPPSKNSLYSPPRKLQSLEPRRAKQAALSGRNTRETSSSVSRHVRKRNGNRHSHVSWRNRRLSWQHKLLPVRKFPNNFFSAWYFAVPIRVLLHRRGLPRAVSLKKDSFGVSILHSRRNSSRICVPTTT